MLIDKNGNKTTAKKLVLQSYQSQIEAMVEYAQGEALKRSDDMTAQEHADVLRFCGEMQQRLNKFLKAE